MYILISSIMTFCSTVLCMWLRQMKDDFDVDDKAGESSRDKGSGSDDSDDDDDDEMDVADNDNDSDTSGEDDDGGSDAGEVCDTGMFFTVFKLCNNCIHLEGIFFILFVCLQVYRFSQNLVKSGTWVTEEPLRFC